MHRERRHRGNRGIHKRPRESDGGRLYLALATILSGAILIIVFGV